MLTREENELLTRTGPGTPMGELMRRYWVPALFSHHLHEPDCPPVRVKLFGEQLVAFRDSVGRVGLVDEHCPHRGASLFFGRNEERGLRCVYHGWKYEVSGQCVDMPNEPAESNFKDKIRVKAYPCRELGGVVWAYLGPPGLEPGLPELEWAIVPESHRHATRRLQECNWLQGLEGGFDPTHLAFLHRGSRVTSTALNVRSPTVPPSQSAIVPTGCGLMLGSRRGVDGQRDYWSVNQWMLPFHKLITRLTDDAPIGAHVWVPIDDESCMVYSVEYHPDRPLSDVELEPMTDGRYIHAETAPGSDRTVRNMQNDYLIDRDLQRSGASFTGVFGIGMQDSFIQESMGLVYDRSTEHLGTSDAFLVTIRRRLLEVLGELEEGGTPPGLDPAAYRLRSAGVVAPSDLSFEEAVAEAVIARSAAYADLAV